MIVSGLGTQDSPILLDEDSESEVVTELIGSPSPRLAHREDSEFTPRLSPRPGTFLSNKARLNLSQSSAQHLKKYRQDLRQYRKRKRVPISSHVNGSCLAGGQLDSASVIVDVTVDGVYSETEPQRPLLNQPKKVSQSRIGPPTKRPKHNHKPNNEPIALPDRPPPATPQESSSMSISNLSSALGPTSCPDAPRPITKHSRFSDSTTIPSSMTSTSCQFDPIPLPFSATAPDHFPSQFVSMMQEPFPGMNMDFDPMFWAMSMSMNGIAASSTPIPPMGIPLPPKATTSGKLQPKLPRPSSKSSVKPEPKPRLSPSKTSTNSEDTIPEHLPARSPHLNEGASVSRQRPFTLRPTTDSSMTAPAYIPIGKPDFRDIHGVFPIIPSLMLPAPSGVVSVSFTPDLDRTLVLENLPKRTCSKVWIQSWCLKACGSLPKLFLLGPRRALVMFKQPIHAIDAWASPKLGVDENGSRTIGISGESKAREDVITAYWYRPDVVKERQLMISWKSSKKMVTEIKKMLALSVDESVIAKVLTEQSDKMLELCQVQLQVPTDEPRAELQKMADRMRFHEDLAEMVRNASTEEDILKWEQREIAWIERERRMKTLPHDWRRRFEVGKVGGDEERRNGGNKSSLRCLNAQTVPVFVLDRSQRNPSGTSTSTGGTVFTNAVPGPSSMSKLLASTSSLLPAKAKSLQKPPLLSSSHINTTASRTTPLEKSDYHFGQTAWKSLEFTTSMRRPSGLNSYPPPATLPAKPQLTNVLSCDATASPIQPTITSFTKEKFPHNTPRMSPAPPILDDPKEVADSLESQTVSSDISLHHCLPSSTTRNPPQPGDSSESVRLQLPTASSPVFSAASESVSFLNSGKAAALTSTGPSTSSLLASTPVMAVASSFGEDNDRVQISDTITVQNVAVKAGSPAAVASPLTLVSAARPAPGIPLKMLQELKRVLAKSTEERQQFLENEFKATRLLMDRLTTVIGKTERKQVTDLWKQKIRIIDEVTRSIRNDAKVWYSQETKTWIRMRWPYCLNTSGVLVLDDDDED